MITGGGGGGWTLTEEEGIFLQKEVSYCRMWSFIPENGLLLHRGYWYSSFRWSPRFPMKLIKVSENNSCISSVVTCVLERHSV